jgi:glycosyltransferase involved in cell wall biosynthesis
LTSEPPASQLDGGRRIETTVVIPAYNEEQGLPVVLDKLLVAVDDRTEVLVVNDGSTDATAEVARRYDVRLVEHSANRGKAEAMRTGIAQASGENVVFIDADDTYPPAMVPLMTESLRRYEMVVCARTGGQSHIPVLNRLGNLVFRLAIQGLYGYPLSDPFSGFYGLRRDALLQMQLRSSGFQIETEISVKAASLGLAMTELPIVYRSRIGTAKLKGARDGLAILLTIVSMLPAHNRWRSRSKGTRNIGTRKRV